MKPTRRFQTACLLLSLLLGCGPSSVLGDNPPSARQTTVALPVRSASVTLISALPATSKGNDFPSSVVGVVGGKVRVAVSEDPIYVLDGDTSVGSVDLERSPFGIHPALVPDDPDGPFARAQRLGVRWHRGIYAYWIKIQPTEEDVRKGIFHWETTDGEWGAVPKSMNILANIGLPERLQDGPGPPGTPFRPPTTWKLNLPESAYVTFVKAVVERYDGDGKEDMPGLKVPVKYWQFENEPDGWGNRDWEGYAHLQELTYGTIKEACPEAKVLIGGQVGLAPDAFQQFFEPALRRLRGKSVDVFDFHWFGNAGRDGQLLEMLIKDTRARLDALGYAACPIWICETGTYSGQPGDEASPALPGAPPTPPMPPQSEREQAQDLVKRYTLALSMGVHKVFWAFGLMEGFQNDDGYFDHTGLIYDGRFDHDPPRGTPKLAYYSYAKMTRLLEGADWPRARRLDLGVGIYAFEVPKGQGTVTVLWGQ
ncbi:hypothetical protein IV102_37425 [bacterium]|nr:hypothetical protein [bacterium]